MIGLLEEGDELGWAQLAVDSTNVSGYQNQGIERVRYCVEGCGASDSGRENKQAARWQLIEINNKQDGENNDRS